MWKEEAFALWGSQWQSLYEKGSSSEKVIEEIKSKYFLVSVVDNDFVNGNIFNFFYTATSLLGAK